MVDCSIKRFFEVLIIVWIFIDVIMVISLCFIDFSSETYNMIIVFDTLLCIILFIEFVFKMSMSDNKLRFMKVNWLDIIAMIPFELVSFPLLRFTRLARLLRIFRLIRLIILFEKGKKNFLSFLSKTHLHHGLFTLFIMLSVCTFTFFLLETGFNVEVNGWQDALWYSVVTISTVGYGDIVPKTYPGKVIGVVLIFSGALFYSFLTAALSSWFVKGSKEQKIESQLNDMDKSINDIKTEINALKDILREV